jgi:hypothetical protein
MIQIKHIAMSMIFSFTKFYFCKCNGSWEYTFVFSVSNKNCLIKYVRILRTCQHRKQDFMFPP